MASYRPLGQFNQYFLNSGAVNNGGSITFYETDLTTLKDTYSDDGLTIVNSNPVLLDSSGRLSTDVWGSGNYGAVIKDRLGTVIETRNNIQSGASIGQTIPALVTGDFLTNDGSNLLWSEIIQVPDPTGYSGQILSNDGATVFWQSISALNIPTVSTTGSALTVGPWIIQKGSGTIAATGTTFASGSFTFPTPFSATAYAVIPVYTGTGLTVENRYPSFSISSKSASGFGLILNINYPDNMTNACTFDYVAIGLA